MNPYLRGNSYGPVCTLFQPQAGANWALAIYKDYEQNHGFYRFQAYMTDQFSESPECYSFPHQVYGGPNIPAKSIIQLAQTKVSHQKINWMNENNDTMSIIANHQDDITRPDSFLVVIKRKQAVSLQFVVAKAWFQ